MNVNQTKVTNYYTIFPNHLNRHGTLFGGQTLYWLDEVTGLVIRRYTDLPFFTASIDSYQFLDVVNADEALIIESYVSRVGNRSLETFVELSAFNHNTRETRLVGLSFSTFGIKREVELKEPLKQVVYNNEDEKFVNETFDKRKSGELSIREFCKIYKEQYYNKKKLNEI